MGGAEASSQKPGYILRPLIEDVVGLHVLVVDSSTVNVTQFMAQAAKRRQDHRSELLFLFAVCCYPAVRIETIKQLREVSIRGRFEE